PNPAASHVTRSMTGSTELGLPAKPVTPSAFVPRLASELDVSDQIRQRARQLAEASESTGPTATRWTNWLCNPTM
ncbi:MAG: transcription initiation factor TFIIB, partial [Natronomonas sp.]